MPSKLNHYDIFEVIDTFLSCATFLKCGTTKTILFICFFARRNAARTLLHCSTGNYFTFLDFKGGATVNSYYSHKGELTEQVANDLVELLAFLISNQVAHPYDDVLAGAVA